MQLSLSPISISNSLDGVFDSLKKDVLKPWWRFFNIIEIAFLKRRLVILKKESAKNIKPQLDALYLIVEGSLKMIDEFDQEEAKLELTNVRNCIAEFDEINQALVDSNFFDSCEIEKSHSRSMSALFNLELNLKKIAYRGHAIPADANLKRAMANSSRSIVNTI